ncbi:MAG: PqiC family protein [Gammaproteobacteria bacterium]|nr:PqiC family protein [Gammaproteobacteria bacterium]
MNRIQVATTACIALLLGACASSPPVQFYALDSVPRNIGQEIGGINIGLGPMTFPDYLKRPQIVTRTAGSEIKLAEFQRWAEPVDRSFSRILASNVDDMLESAIVVVFPYNMNIRVDMRVIGRVFRFDTNTAGLAVLDVQWAAGDGKGGNIVEPRRLHYEAQASDPQDYDAIVLALNETLDAFSRDMAAALEEHL